MVILKRILVWFVIAFKYHKSKVNNWNLKCIVRLIARILSLLLEEINLFCNDNKSI